MLKDISKAMSSPTSPLALAEDNSMHFAEHFAEIPDVAPPSYEDVVAAAEQPTPIIVNLISHAYVKTPPTAPEKQYVGPRLSTHKTATNVTSHTTYRAFALACLTLFSLSEPTNATSFAISTVLRITALAGLGASQDIPVDKGNWEAVRRMILDSVEGKGHGTEKVEVFVAVARRVEGRVGWGERVRCKVREVGRKVGGEVRF